MTYNLISETNEKLKYYRKFVINLVILNVLPLGPRNQVQGIDIRCSDVLRSLYIK